MSQSIQAFTIGEIAVRQQDGLFSLNDLHRASGGRAGHRPGNFLQIDQTKALLAEIETAGIPAVSSATGRRGGTYACRELVIAYAAWISAAFHLKVIRVFLDVTAPTAPAQMNLDCDRSARQAADAVAAAVHQHVLQELQTKAGWQSGRWLLSFNFSATGPQPSVRMLERGEHVVPASKLAVDRQKLAAIWNDLGKLRERVDGLGVMESDLPPSWWDTHRISN